MSKGSHRRNEDVKKIWDNWDQIFGKKDQPAEEPKQEEPKTDTPNENAK
jgi:hypothetical protein